MSETVEISRDGRARAEFFGKIFYAEFYLPYERFARRQIAIGLQIPTARNLPFAFFNEFSYFFERFGNVFLDILVSYKIQSRSRCENSCAAIRLSAVLKRILKSSPLSAIAIISRPICIFSSSVSPFSKTLP